MAKKDNNIMIRLSDEELSALNNGWYMAVTLLGRPVTRSEYLRACITYMQKFLHEADEIGAYDDFFKMEV